MTVGNREKALQILESGLKVKEFELLKKTLAQPGTLVSASKSIDLGIKYDPSTGIYGMDFFVVFRTTRVSRQPTQKVPKEGWQVAQADENRCDEVVSTEIRRRYFGARY